ncbi:helix-turn-helix transcriptional regulator [Candidatus Gracilibacteria bacterium]|nr:helix-turn-helix transcriptional regulator [Candidatus Gracilibacteria bacterium]
MSAARAIQRVWRRWRDYPDWETGSRDWYRLIDVEYIQGRGHKTVADVLPVYAPSFENDTNAYVTTVNGFVEQWRHTTWQPGCLARRRDTGARGGLTHKRLLVYNTTTIKRACTEEAMQIATSLEDIRRNRYQTVAEFSRTLNVSTSTYYRALEGRAEIPTMRQIAAALHLPPATIAEFTPPASAALLADIDAGIDDAIANGWLVVDPDTLEPTGEITFDGWPFED